MEIINCAQCLANGKTNRCYITGYDSKCSHDNGWAYTCNKSGTNILTCKSCSGTKNKMYITGFDIKCGHDNGWAYEPNIATCNSCHKTLNGKWSMESNPNNASYLNTTTGRYLGINDGYFLYGTNPNWVYSYCKSCWINEIKKILPSLITDPNQKNATCYACGKELNGKWSMENNPNNASYFSCTTGRYLGISDGYFLYGTNPNWVYSYCKPCWIKQIESILPNLGIQPKETTDVINKLKSENTELNQKISIKENENNELKKKIDNLELKINEKDKEINKIQSINGNKCEENTKLPNEILLDKNYYSSIIIQNLNEIKIKDIIELLNSSGIDEIVDLKYLISFDNISLGVQEEVKKISTEKIKINLKEIIDKIDTYIVNKEDSLSSLTKAYKDVGNNLKGKNVSDIVSNESLNPMKDLIDNLIKKIDKMKDIRQKICNYFIKITI